MFVLLLFVSLRKVSRNNNIMSKFIEIDGVRHRFVETHEAFFCDGACNTKACSLYKLCFEKTRGNPYTYNLCHFFLNGKVYGKFELED